MNTQWGDAKWKGGVGVVAAAPSPTNPLKAVLGLSVIHSILGAQCRGLQASLIPSLTDRPTNRPSHATHNTPVIGTGWQTESFKTTSVHASNRSTFFISHSDSEVQTL